jgi:hypothetical protein
MYSSNNVPIALRAMLDKQLRYQWQPGDGNQIKPSNTGMMPQVGQFTRGFYHQIYKDNSQLRRNSRVRSLDLRMRPISSAPIYIGEHLQKASE